MAGSRSAGSARSRRSGGLCVRRVRRQVRRLRALPGGDQPKILFCTIETRPERIAEALAAGADDYVMKPFDGEILQSKLMEVGAIAA